MIKEMQDKDKYSPPHEPVCCFKPNSIQERAGIHETAAFTNKVLWKRKK